MPQTIHHRLHVLEAADWKDGVITLLEPSSPYRPWRYAFGEARPGDCAIVVLGTDPACVLTILARIDHEGGLGGAMLDTRRYRLNVVDLTSLAMVLDLPDVIANWRLDDDAAERTILALHETKVHGSPFYRWGHSSIVAARNLLNFGGECQGCGEEIDLTGDDARDQIYVHTVAALPRPEPDSPIRTLDSRPWHRPYRTSLRESARDWPAVLCRRCHTRMRNGDFTSFVDFRFAQHPACPDCGGRRTQSIGYGEPFDHNSWGPWRHMGGCVGRADKWHCDICDHDWA